MVGFPPVVMPRPAPDVTWPGYWALPLQRSTQETGEELVGGTTSPCSWTGSRCTRPPRTRGMR